MAENHREGRGEKDLKLEDMEARAQDKDAWKELVADLWTLEVQKGLIVI